MSAANAHGRRALSALRRLVPRAWRPGGEGAPPTDVLDMRPVTDDPLEALYRAAPRPVVVDLPLARCLGLRRPPFLCTASAGHPYVLTLTSYARGECRAYRDSPLQRYFETWRPASAAAALGLAEDEVSADLAAQLPLGAAPPWWPIDPAEEAARVARVIRRENREHGASLDAAEGAPDFGPVTDAKGELEFRRLTRIYDAVREVGYTPDAPGCPGHIRGYLLARAGSWRVMIETGNHRIAALAALGYQRIPVRLGDRPIVRREEAASWPNVRSGVFTRRQALAVFDRAFHGQLPARCEWPPPAVCAQ